MLLPPLRSLPSDSHYVGMVCSVPDYHLCYNSIALPLLLPPSSRETLADARPLSVPCRRLRASVGRTFTSVAYPQSALHRLHVVPNSEAVGRGFQLKDPGASVNLAKIPRPVLVSHVSITPLTQQRTERNKSFYCRFGRLFFLWALWLIDHDRLTMYGSVGCRVSILPPEDPPTGTSVFPFSLSSTRKQSVDA